MLKIFYYKSEGKCEDIECLLPIIHKPSIDFYVLTFDEYILFVITRNERTVIQMKQVVKAH